MNTMEIAERLILATEIAMAAGGRVGPAPLRAQQLPYTHSADDMRNWGHRRGDRRSRKLDADACRLLKEDEDAHAMYRRAFFEKLDFNARMISEADEADGWYALVQDEDARSALAAWVWCMADSKRRHFQDWCAKSGFSRETGRRRKNAALASIHAHLVRGAVQNCDNHHLPMLHSGTDLDDIADTAEAGVGEEKSPPAWLSETGFTNIFALGDAEFSWADKRNKQRRQREDAKRKQEAA